MEFYNGFDLDQGLILAEQVHLAVKCSHAERRNQEREEIQKLAKIDIRAYYEAMKEWGLNREKRFSEEGWRKMSGRRY